MSNVGMTPTLFRWLAQQMGRLTGMTRRDDARPAMLTQKPSWLISEISRVAHPLITDKLATAGSRGYHYRLLAALQEFGPASQASLGRRTGMDRSDVVAAVHELVGRGLAGRAPDPADGAATSSASPRPAPPISGGWRSSWPASRTSCSPRFHRPSASSWSACSAGSWNTTPDCIASQARSHPEDARAAVASVSQPAQAARTLAFSRSNSSAEITPRSRRSASFDSWSARWPVRSPRPAGRNGGTPGPAAGPAARPAHASCRRGRSGRPARRSAG